MIVILTQDLMMSSSVSAVARAKGLEFKSAASIDRVIKLVQEHAVSKLLIDLQMAGLSLSELMSRLSTLETGKTVRTIAYAQHVHVDLLNSARQAGIDQVYTRGQVHGNLESLLV